MNGPAIDPSVIDNLRQLNQPGEPDIVQQVLSLFLTDAAARIDALVRAVERGDAAALHRTAHALKGAAANIGATALQEQCRELEALGKQGTVAGAAPLLAALVAEFARVRAEIARYA